MTKKNVRRIQRAYNRGKNDVQVAALTGYCIATVRKYRYFDVEKAKDNPKLKRKPKDETAEQKPQIIDYEPLVREWLVADKGVFYKQTHTAKRVFDRLRELHADFRFSYKTVQRLFNRVHAEVFASEKGYASLDPNLIGQAEVTCTSVSAKIDGKSHEAFALLLSFPFSRAGYLQVIPARNTECILAALQKIFTYIGGVPTAITFTPTTKLYDYVGKDIADPTDTLFTRFILYHQFIDKYFVPDYNGSPVASCSSLMGYYKAKTINGIRNIKNLDEFNSTLFAKCEELFGRLPRYERNKTVEQLFQLDTAALNKLPDVPLEIVTWFQRKVDKTATLTISSKWQHPLKPSFKNRPVFVHLYADKVEVRNLNNDLIVSIPRSYSKEAVVVENHEDLLGILNTKPNAIFNCSITERFSTEFAEFLVRSSSSVRRGCVKAMSIICAKSDIETAIAFVSKSALSGLKNSTEICELYEVENA